MARRCAVLAAAVAAVGAELHVSVAADGTYELILDGGSWFKSAPIGYAAHWSNMTHTSLSGLTMDGPPAPISGSDALGPFSGSQITWNSNVWVTRFKNYPARSAVVFEQYFPVGMKDTSLFTPNSHNDLVTAFPAWGPPHSQLSSKLGYMAWHDTMCGSTQGQWTTAGVNVGNFADVGGIAITFNSSFSAVAISSLTDFMTSGISFAPIVNGSFAAGFNGMLEGIPVGWTHSTIMVGGQGVNETMYSWGDALLTLGGKKRTAPDADISTKYLSYWTDNGAYYYYLTETGKTYQDTLLDVKQYLMGSLQLPIHYFQWDSWWYFKEPDRGALLLWEPMPDVFPSGWNWLGLPTVNHNRYFAAVNNYTQNYSFLTVPGKNYALPIDQRMFEYIMGKAQKEGNMQIYEQDWLVTVWEEMDKVTKVNITAAASWMSAMSGAATKLGLTMQLCMALPNHMLYSTLMQPVTTSRASGDYSPGADNWKIQWSSLFFWAVGVAPSKDDYWTTEVQTGNPYGEGTTEPNWQLQAIVIALSTGPNGPSDKLGAANATLLMSTCRGDGLTLQPARPLIGMEAALKGIFSGAVVPDVRATWNQHAGYRWHYIFAAELSDPNGFTFNFQDLGPSLSTQSYGVFDYFNPRGGPVSMLNVGGAFTIAHGQGQPSAPTKAHSIRYFIVAPVLPGGWMLFGEAGKITSMSAQRVMSMTLLSDGFSAMITGSAAETSITYLVANTGKAGVTDVACPSGAGAMPTLSCTGGACSCN